MKAINLKTKKDGFTLIEIMIVLVIIAILATTSFFIYFHFIEKAKSSEAIIVAGDIRGAEIANKLDKGEYVGAESTGEINASLGLGIIPKDYDYRVVGVSDQDFMILVNKIDTGKIVLAMNKDGLIQQKYDSGGGTGGSGGGETGGSSGGGTGGSGGGTGGSGGDGGTGGSGGGTGGSGGDGTDGSSGGGSISGSLSHTGGGWSNLAPEGGSGALIGDGLLAAFNLLKDSTAAAYAYNLIEYKRIPLAFATPAEGSTAGAWWNGSGIFVNINQKDSSASAIAAFIAHEATHADYSYYSNAWIDITLERHSELQAGDLHIIQYPYNSIDQEYNAACNGMKTWIELKGTDTNSFQDSWLREYIQGEEYMRDQIRIAYRANNYPEY